MHHLNGYNTTNHQRDSGKSNNDRNLPTTSYTQHSDRGAYCSSNRIPSDPISSIQHHWPIIESYDLALACQLVLLFLPPVMFSRLKIMVDLLRRVLSNHERLASWLVNYGSRENIENKSENILPSDTLSSLEITLHVVGFRIYDDICFFSLKNMFHLCCNKLFLLIKCKLTPIKFMVHIEQVCVFVTSLENCTKYFRLIGYEVMGCLGS